LFLWLLLFLAPPLPIAVYLLLLGALNRGRHPVLVPGAWDFAGILFAASGFLLCGGPVVLSLLNDHWRQSWLMSQAGADAPNSSGTPFWMFLFLLYYVIVVLAAVYLVRRQRRLTAVYNAMPQIIEQALGQVLDRLGLNPIRSGPVYLFGSSSSVPANTKGNKPASIQTSPYQPGVARKELIQEVETAAPQLELSSVWAGQTTVLEVDAFPVMKHVTLRWDPADSLLRKEIENDLALRLVEYPAPNGSLGAWMTFLGFTILGTTLMGGCAGVFVLMAAR